MRPHELHIPAWFSASELQPHAARFVRYILQWGYSKGTLHKYRNAAAHFAHWMTGNDIACSKLDEVEADLAMKERTLKSLRPPKVKTSRFRPSDRLIQFLSAL